MAFDNRDRERTSYHPLLIFGIHFLHSTGKLQSHRLPVQPCFRVMDEQLQIWFPCYYCWWYSRLCTYLLQYPFSIYLIFFPSLLNQFTVLLTSKLEHIRRSLYKYLQDPRKIKNWGKKNVEHFVLIIPTLSLCSLISFVVIITSIYAITICITKTLKML